MIFESVSTGGCRSYLVGCEESCAAVLVDPELSQIDRYIALSARHGLRFHYLIDTHTHADHFSATRELAHRLEVPVVMHRSSPAPFVDLRLEGGELLVVGRLRLQSLHTPGHTPDSMCLWVEDRLFTGDTLLIGATGRTDLPGGDAEALYETLFHGVLKLDPALKVFPAHEYKGRSHSTIGQELAELKTSIENHRTELIVLDVRERDAYEAGHISGAMHLPRGQLELRVNEDLKDPTRRILVCCEFGRISTLATATLRAMGFQRAVALDGGMKAWREAGNAVTDGREPQ